jgi:hypothetical protein
MSKRSIKRMGEACIYRLKLAWKTLVQVETLNIQVWDPMCSHVPNLTQRWAKYPSIDEKRQLEHTHIHPLTILKEL